MRPVIYDVECTISNKGNPFDRSNILVCAGITNPDNRRNSIIYYPTPKDVGFIDSIFSQSDVLVVGFNLKFDLNWHRRIRGSYPNRVWDCQLAAFLLSNQKNKYPSLNGELERYGYPPKLDVVEKEYWDKGINTDQIPRDILSKYLEGDLEKTNQVFRKQYEQFMTTHKHLYSLFKLQCLDLIVLADMEYNGVVFNTEKARKRANEISERQTEIQNTLTQYIGNVPISFTSDAHLSTILYGGIILEEYRIPIGIYATGDKKGQTRYKVNYKTYEFPRLIEPLKGSQVKEKVSKKELAFIEKGILVKPREQFSVDADTLHKVKAKGDGKKLIDLILEFNKLDKLRSTYLEGWSNLIDEKNWEPNILHSQLNQCLAITGRLSSSQPNGQNADKATKLYCESRY